MESYRNTPIRRRLGVPYSGFGLTSAFTTFSNVSGIVSTTFGGLPCGFFTFMGVDDTSP